MRFRDLDAVLLAIETPTTYRHVDRVADADGVRFLCPKCHAANGGPVGTHSVLCWFVGVDPALDPKPGRWIPSGTTIDDFSFVGPGAESVLLTGPGCGWHGFVRAGDAT
jgi:hypothetical protein